MANDRNKKPVQGHFVKIERGALTVYADGEDSDRNRFVLKESSAVAAGEHDGPFVWLTMRDQITGQHLGHDVEASLHLNIEAAEELRDGLSAFLKAAGR